MTPFHQLKDICTTACHDRHACAEGYRAMLATENISQLMAVWRANWEDIVESKYADIINDRLPSLYPTLRAEMNAAGIYVNECPKMAPEYVRVLVTDTGSEVHVYDYARAYVLGQAKLTAHGHSQVYNFKQDADITLTDRSYGYIAAGKVTRLGFSTLNDKRK